MAEFEDTILFIPDSKDDPNAFVKVATITNTSERIVRVVAKGHYSLTIEVLYCEIGKYEWRNMQVYLDREEIKAIAAAVATLPKDSEES